MAGFVYVITCGSFAKIGFSANPRKRYLSIQTANPSKCVLAATWPGSRKLEKALHKKFSHRRSHLEWFHLSSEILSLIECGPTEQPDDDCCESPLSGLSVFIERIGGATKLAQSIGVPAGTVGAWKYRGRIHYRHYRKIIEAAKNAGVNVGVEDLLRLNYRKEAV